MGVKGNLIGHTGYVEGDTAVYIKAEHGDVGQYYQPVYLRKQPASGGVDPKKGEITACNYNDVYYNVPIGPFYSQTIPELERYPYIYDYIDSRITDKTYAQCVLSESDANSGKISPIVKTFNRTLRLYANQPLDYIVLQTLALFNLHKPVDKGIDPIWSADDIVWGDGNSYTYPRVYDGEPSDIIATVEVDGESTELIIQGGTESAVGVHTAIAVGYADPYADNTWGRFVENCTYQYEITAAAQSQP